MEIEFGNLNNERYKRILSFVIIVSICQQMPYIKDNYYGIFRNLLYFLFAFLCFKNICSIKMYWKYQLVKFISLTMIYATFLTLLCYILGTGYRPVLQLMIPFGILICSLGVEFTECELRKLIIVYTLLVTIMGVSSVFYYSNGFEITQTYSIPMKNQMGPILGNGFITLTYMLFSRQLKKEKNSRKLFYMMLLIAIFLSLIVTRNRSGIIGCITICFLMYIRNGKMKLTLRNIILVEMFFVVMVLLWASGQLNILMKMIWDSLTLNYDVTDLQSLSSGRMSNYYYAYEFILDNLTTGSLVTINKFQYGNTHNYILFNLVRYGVFLFTPFMIFFVYLIKFIVSGVFDKSTDSISRVSIWLLSLSIFVSIFEYSYPYGPGVTQLIVWVLLGQYIKLNE